MTAAVSLRHLWRRRRAGSAAAAARRAAVKYGAAAITPPVSSFGAYSTEAGAAAAGRQLHRRLRCSRRKTRRHSPQWLLNGPRHRSATSRRSSGFHFISILSTP